jgi:hypothetical protein
MDWQSHRLLYTRIDFDRQRGKFTTSWQNISYYTCHASVILIQDSVISAHLELQNIVSKRALNMQERGSLSEKSYLQIKLFSFQ